MIEKLNVAGYIRKSSQDKNTEDVSLENQKRFIESFCIKKGYNLIKIYNEGYHTGTDSDRPVFTEMFDDAIKGRFDAIIIKDETRFSRDQTFLVNRCRTLSAWNVKLFTINGEELTSDRFTGLKGWISEQVIDKSKKDWERMIKDKQDEGLPFGSVIFGYKYNKKKNWVIVPKEAEIVRNVFNLILAGKKYKEIIDEVGISVGKYYRIIKNKSYTGIFCYNKKIKGKDFKVERTEHIEYQATYEPIITLETFNQVQNILNAKNSSD